MKEPSIAVLLGGHPALKGEKPDSDEGEDIKTPAELKSAMDEFAKAWETKDNQAMADAFHSAFLICESAPHREAGEIEESESDEE